MLESVKNKAFLKSVHDKNGNRAKHDFTQCSGPEMMNVALLSSAQSCPVSQHSSYHNTQPDMTDVRENFVLSGSEKVVSCTFLSYK